MKMADQKKIIGILGGMGPAASAYCYSQIIRLAQEKYGARNDADFPRVVLYNLALAEMNENGISDNDRVVAGMRVVDGVQKLEQLGSDFVIIPCNTAHYFFQAIEAIARIPVLNIIEETSRKVKDSRCDMVGVCGTTSTIRWGLYEHALQKRGIGVVLPDTKQQKSIAGVIANVEAGRHGEWDKRILQSIAKDFAKRGAKGMILGCTELPLAINEGDTDIKVFDTSSILAEAALAYAMPKAKEK